MWAPAVSMHVKAFAAWRIAAWAAAQYPYIEHQQHAESLHPGLLHCAVSVAQVGYASSWSAYSIYRKQHPDRPDPLVEYRQQLLAALEAEVRQASCVQPSLHTIAFEHMLQGCK